MRTLSKSDCRGRRRVKQLTKKLLDVIPFALDSRPCASIEGLFNGTILDISQATAYQHPVLYWKEST